MAKIIRCPNCGENVEVPPNPTGQMVTCVACGTVLRLKSKKDANLGQLTGDSSAGSFSGSMSATTITDRAASATSDEPPSFGSECDVCGRSVDPSELVEDRGRLTCRACLKKSTPAGRARKEEGLIPLADERPSGPARRGRMVTFGAPFIGGCAALVLWIGCNVFLAFYPKPVGSRTVAKVVDEPPPSTESAWDVQNRPIIERMMSEAAALKADPNRLAEAKQKYDAIVAMAKGQVSGSQEVRRLVDLAEKEAEALKVAVVEPTDTTTQPAPPQPGTTPPPPEAVVSTPPPPVIEVPDTVAPPPNSVFDDIEVSITDKLNAGMTSLEAALAQPGEPAVPHAKEALLRFSEARSLLIREKRNLSDDPGWSFSNHGTAVAYILSRNYPFAVQYLDRLPSPPDRAALLNRVVVLLQMRENKAEAIRLLLAHLQSDPEAEDVYAINLLGTVLGRYPEETIQQEKDLREAKNTYNAMVKKLGAKYPGERRWGVRWLSPREFDEKLREATLQKSQLAKLERILAMARNRIDEYSRKHMAPQLEIARSDEQRALQEIATLRANMTAEEWLTPEQIVPVLPDVTAVNARSRAGDGGGATRPTTAP